MSETIPCQRCGHVGAPEYERPRARKLAWIYFAAPLPFVPFLPIIASDMFVMLPLTMLYLVGLGPVIAIARQKPVCAECGAFLR